MWVLLFALRPGFSYFGAFIWSVTHQDIILPQLQCILSSIWMFVSISRLSQSHVAVTQFRREVEPQEEECAACLIIYNILRFTARLPKGVFQKCQRHYISLSSFPLLHSSAWCCDHGWMSRTKHSGLQRISISRLKHRLNTPSTCLFPLQWSI